MGAARCRQVDITDEGVAEATRFEASHQRSDYHPDYGTVATDLSKNLVQGLDVPILIDLITTQGVLNLEVSSIHWHLVQSSRLHCLKLVCLIKGIEVTEVDRKHVKVLV